MRCELIFYRDKNKNWIYDNFVRQLDPTISEQKHRIEELIADKTFQEFVSETLNGYLNKDILKSNPVLNGVELYPLRIWFCFEIDENNKISSNIKIKVGCI